LFSPLCEDRVVYDWFQSAAKFHLGSELTFEKSSASCRASSVITLDHRNSHYCSINFQRQAQKTLREFSAPSADNVLVEPSINIGAENFKIKTGLITMVQAILFYGKANQDASAHLQ
jgi:hypothetical protein